MLKDFFMFIPSELYLLFKELFRKFIFYVQFDLIQKTWTKNAISEIDSIKIKEWKNTVHYMHRHATRPDFDVLGES